MKKVLVANRGEIACRVMRSCREAGIQIVGVYSEADANSLHVEIADEAHLIGSANARDSYLSVDKILKAAKDANADAIHPGYGFLAENAEFAESVKNAGLVWIGPSPQSIREMGDKERARNLAKESGVPILPGSDRFSGENVDTLKGVAAQIGYPMLIKASGGGGGIGMRLVTSSEGLADAVMATSTLANRAFGNADIFLERYIASARHVEIQVFGFGNGNAVHFYERECSIQRRFQKIIEETPSPGISPDTRAAMCAAAVTLTKNRQYSGAGTVEFVVDDETGEFFFLEMNTRIQVEHPVTEMTCGVDLVALQLSQSAGLLEDLKQNEIASRGHAIECRIYAENPAKMFLPSPGKLETLHFPKTTEKFRVDTGFRAGDTITPYYDPMIAKVIAFGSDRAEATATMAEALRESHISGVVSNLPFLQRCIAHRDFTEGKTTTNFVEINKPDLV